MNTSKPLKTVEVEEILAAVYLAGTENGLSRSITDPKEIVHRREAFIKANPVCKEAKADLYQLMLSLKPEEKEGVKEYRDSDGEAYLTCKTCGGYDECDCDGYNEALADWEAKLSEHFNGEGEV